MRDFVPQDRFGRYFGNRLFLATALGAVVSLTAGLGVDAWKSWQPEALVWAYSALFIVGALAGEFGVYFLAVTPEPRMPALDTREKLRTLLARPFRDANYRKLIYFLGSWNFAVNLAAPFFTGLHVAAAGLWHVVRRDRDGDQSSRQSACLAILR